MFDVLLVYLVGIGITVIYIGIYKLTKVFKDEQRNIRLIPSPVRLQRLWGNTARRVSSKLRHIYKDREDL